jgi:hypothetical protein
MTAIELLTIGAIFVIGAITGIVILVSVASNREDRRARLSREAPDAVTRAARMLTNLYVRRPGDDQPAPRRRDDDQAKFSGRPLPGATLMTPRSRT